MFLIVILLVLAIIAVLYVAFGSERSQLFGPFPWRIDTKQKVVALTFDDGPNPPYTLQILDYLNSKNIKATFFQVGDNAKKYPDVTKKLAQSGHIIGNHSLNHAFHNYLTQPGYDEQITQSQAIFKDILGQEPALFRPPWLWRYPLLFKTLRSHGLQPVSGIFCHPWEVFHVSAAKIAKRVLARAKPGSIIIFHDGYNAKGADRSQTVEAVKIVTEELLKQGYKFVTISELLGVPAYHKS